jgi:4-amino-4-deoxy-L-arabinose transferase-like glycosyltransferase
MAKKRQEREDRKKKTGDEVCDLDAGFVSPGLSFRHLSPDTIKTTLLHSRYAQILVALTLIGAFLRFYQIGFNPLWLDEASTYTFATLSIPGIWQATMAGEFNPPLFYWIEHVMLMLGNNETVLRLVPALAGVLTIPLVYWEGKEFIDRNVGIIAAAICTFSPFLIYYSQEARAYSLALFFVAFAMIFFLKALKSDSMADWVAFGVLSALALWSHFYAMVVIGSLVLYALAVRIPGYLKDARAAVPLVAGIAAFAVLCLPLIFVSLQLFTKRTTGGPSFGIQGADVIVETFRQLSGFSQMVMVLFLVLFAIGIIQAFLMEKKKGILLLALTILPFAISWFLSYKIPMVPRYLIILAPIFFIGIALAYKPAYRLVSNRAIVYGFIAVMVLLCITTPFFSGYYSSYTKEDWRGFAGQVRQSAGPGDLIVLVPGYMTQPFDYYYTNATEGTFEYGASTADELAAISALKGNNTVYYVVTGDIASADSSGASVTWLQEHAKGVEATPGIYLFTDA